MVDWSENMWNCALQPLKPFYLGYYNAYDHQTQQGSDLPWGAPNV